MKIIRKSNKHFVSLLSKYIINERTERINDLIEVVHPSDLAEILDKIDRELIVKFFDLAASQYTSEILVELGSNNRSLILESLNNHRIKEIMKELPFDDKIEILNNLTENEKKRILDLLEDKEELISTLNFDSDSAVNLMTKDYVTVNENDTIENVLAIIRVKGETAEIIYYIYIVDSNGLIVGVMSLREILLSKPEEKIKDIMHRKVITIKKNTDQEEAAHLMAKYDLIALPVVDEEKRIKGIITIDDIVDVIHEEGTEDIFKKAGFTFESKESDYSSDLIHGSIFNVIKSRLPWLFLVLVGGLLAGGVISRFEAALESLVALAFFIPVIMDMGGNVGTQSSTIFVRAVVLGHIDLQNFGKHLKKELLIGFNIGVISSILLSLLAFLWQQDMGLSIVIGLSMFLTIILASSVGYLVPWILIKFGFDSASASDPLITTIKDITGLMIYFSLAQLFLGYI